MNKYSQYLEWEIKFRNEEAPGFPYLGMDPDFEEALRGLGISKGTVLDLGTGLGLQAIALAEMGFDVVATDISDTAIRRASTEARKRCVDVTFLQDNILKTKLKKEFDFACDRGCFAVLPVPGQKIYVEAVRRIIKPGGYLFLKCDACPDYIAGTVYYTPEKIRELFETSFAVLSVKTTVYQMNKDKPFYKALFNVLQKPPEDAREHRILEP
jgi:SAM-dependent methyltransferase